LGINEMINLVSISSDNNVHGPNEICPSIYFMIDDATNSYLNGGLVIEEPGTYQVCITAHVVTGLLGTSGDIDIYGASIMVNNPWVSGCNNFVCYPCGNTIALVSSVGGTAGTDAILSGCVTVVTFCPNQIITLQASNDFYLGFTAAAQSALNGLLPKISFFELCITQLCSTSCPTCPKGCTGLTDSCCDSLMM